MALPLISVWIGYLNYFTALPTRLYNDSELSRAFNSPHLSFFGLWRRIVQEKGSYITEDGLTKLQQELEQLRTVGRKKTAARIQKAKELGGAIDNAEYDDSKNEQAFIEGRILTLEKITTGAIIIGQKPTKTDQIRLGSHVTILNQSGDAEEYTIVGSTEANPSRGLISNESPVGKALLNKKVGQEVPVETPTGVITFTISSFS